MGMREVEGKGLDQRLENNDVGAANIDKLPDDLLVHIFSTEIMEKGKRLPPFHYTLMHVCRRWRDLILCSPLLWTIIYISCKEFDSSFFERSRPALFELCVDLEESPEQSLLQRISEALAQNILRLKSLDVQVWNHKQVFEIFEAWRDLPDPNFTRLNISTDRKGNYHPYDMISYTPPVFPIPFWHGGKALVSLTLTRFNYQNLPTLPQLTHLDVDTLDIGSAQFESLLNGYPSLSTLIVRRIGMWIPPNAFVDTDDGDENYLFPDHQVLAPSLRSLSINITSHSNYCKCFLLSLYMENLEDLEVAYLKPPHDKHLHESILPRWKNLPNLRKLRIRSSSIWKDNVSFISFLPSTTHLEIINFPRYGAENSLIFLLGLANLKSITFDLSSPRRPEVSMDLDTLLDILGRHQTQMIVGCPVTFRLPANQSSNGLSKLHGTLGDRCTVEFSQTNDGHLDKFINDEIPSEDERVSWRFDSDDDIEDGEFEDDEFEYDNDFEEDDEFLEDEFQEEDEFEEDVYVC